MLTRHKLSLWVELQLPIDAPAVASSRPRVKWLGELQAMRGAVFYDAGRRPGFRREDGCYADSDPADALCYHILIRSEQGIAACARVMPLTACAPGSLEALLGKEEFSRVLREIGSQPQRTCEASRWVVAPQFRTRGLAVRVVAASWAVARWLGMQTALVAAGTRDKQDRALIKMGAHPVDGLKAIPACEWDDELRILYFDVPNPSPRMATWIDEMTELLELGSRRHATQTPNRRGYGQLAIGRRKAHYLSVRDPLGLRL